MRIWEFLVDKVWGVGRYLRYLRLPFDNVPRIRIIFQNLKLFLQHYNRTIHFIDMHNIIHISANNHPMEILITSKVQSSNFREIVKYTEIRKSRWESSDNFKWFKLLFLINFWMRSSHLMMYPASSSLHRFPPPLNPSFSFLLTYLRISHAGISFTVIFNVFETAM